MIIIIIRLPDLYKLQGIEIFELFNWVILLYNVYNMVPPFELTVNE